jgi:tetratricopeptide (TPR) repeat protein
MRLRPLAIAFPAAIAIAVSSLSAQVAPPPQASPQQPGRTDALLLYRQGRDLESAGKQAEALVKYADSVAICEQELAIDSKRMEAYVVKCWSLFRLGKHQDVITTGQAALKIQFDARAAEVMGESFYHLNQMDNALKYLAKYVDAAGEGGDRVPTAYFYMGETYLRLKKFAHADIAYSTAVKKEPNMPRWWFRLGGACEQLGEWRRAYDAYARALALNPAYQEALDAQERVKPKAGL